MDVQTDHQIVRFGDDRMMLFDAAAGNVIVDCVRADGEWTITADGADDVVVPDRPAAIDAMIAQALEVLPGDGYSTTVPHGLAELP